ncbi:MAG: hypothetical protein LBV49_01310 [Azonexus sp.]|jgi:hypothetical protein|nr:hypothetical protein [Azonexus sp.]
MNKSHVWAMTAAGILSASQTLAADWSFSGMLREEIAVKATNDQNPLNAAGNPYNGVARPNAGLGPLLAPGIAPDTLQRPASGKKDADYNLFATRLELNLDGQLTENWAAHFKLRGFADLVGKVDDAFDNQNIFAQRWGARRNGGGLGMARKDWMLDLPIAYLDYSDGPLWLRLGNQQIAWGEAMFFRVADTANGLDLRRHSLFDVSAEEFSDKRVSSPGARGSFRFNEKLALEGFVQQFAPSVYPDRNSPYNPIPDQFIVDEKTGYDKVKNRMNFGLRLQTKIEDVEMQAFAVRRYNPDGVLRWTAAKGPGAIPGTPFSAGSGIGIYSAAEWLDYASLVRLDGVNGLAAALNEFWGTAPGGYLNATAAGVVNGCGGASGAAHTFGSAAAPCILDTFFDPVVGFGNLQGWLIREYPRENVFGFGVNTVFSGEPDSLTDQLIGRFEISYTPNKKFTNPTLSRNYIEQDETVFAFIAEKYHKFSQSLPATYIVAQWLHKSASDLFGRSLKGYDNTPGSPPKGKSGGANYFAIALQQPSPSLEWRFDFTLLTDAAGGWLIQPGLKWKPGKSLQLDLYGNFLKSDNDGKDFAEGLDHAREIFLRGSWYF